LLAGTVVSTWQALRARQAERAALYQSKRAIAAENKATQERDKARQQRQRADARFRLAFEALSKLSAVSLQVESGAGAERTAKLQRAVKDDLIRFNLQLVENNEDDPAITYELGDAYVGLSQLYGDSDPERRDQAFFKALTLYERQAREKPDHTGILNGLAYQYSRLARNYLRSEPERAEATCRRALDLYEQVARQHPERRDCRIGLPLKLTVNVGDRGPRLGTIS
jgi:hypothetical protein